MSQTPPSDPYEIRVAVAAYNVAYKGAVDAARIAVTSPDVSTFGRRRRREPEIRGGYANRVKELDALRDGSGNSRRTWKIYNTIWRTALRGSARKWANKTRRSAIGVIDDVSTTRRIVIITRRVSRDATASR